MCEMIFGYNDSYVFALSLYLRMNERMNEITYGKQLHVSRELVARLRRLLVPEAALIRHFYTAHNHSAGYFTFARCSFSPPYSIKLT
jgi:hypothetical protein